MVLQFEARLASGHDVLDRDVRDMHLVFGAEGAVLYTGTGQSGGMSVYEIAPGSAVQLVDTAYFSSLPARMTEIRLGMMSVDGEDALFIGTSSSGSLVYFELDPDAGLNAARAAGLAGVDLTAWTAEDPGDDRFYAIDPNTGTVSAYEMGGEGVQPVAVAAGVLPEGSLLTTVDTPSGLVLVVVEGGLVPGLVSYRASSEDGTMDVVDRTGPAEGLGLAAPTAMESITAFDASWVIVGSAGSNTLSVLRVAPDGQLTATDHVLDTLDTRFGNVQALAVVEAQGQVFVFAGGGDDGLSVFSLLPNGRLVLRQSLADAQGLGLNDITAIEAGVIGNEIQIFVASEGLPGLSQFSWSIEELGQVQNGTAPWLQGTAGDDILMAPATGAATLIGGAGDDILISGGGVSVLQGGDGADIFVLAATDAPQRITDFQPGLDRLDLSLLPMLRSASQLTVTPLSDGIELAFQAFRVIVNSASKDTLDVGDIWFAGRFSGPDRLLPETIPVPKTIVGSGNAEALSGGEGRDTLFAEGGDDTVSGAAGEDSLDGGFGHDVIWAGGGDDTVHGDWGRDTVGGAAGADLIDGGGGWDELWGGSGSDTLYGGTGHDTLGAGAGNDLLAGDGGNDMVWGGDGDDTVFGGDGNDNLAGGKGADLLIAGAGNDTIYAAGGHDVINGGAGDDEIWGGSGDDGLHGGNGHDDLRGGDGADTLNGGAGNDVLRGLAGADVFVFEESYGQDRVLDFEPGLDRIEISGGIGFSDLIFAQATDGTEIFSDFGTILLEGIILDQVGAGDFLFY